MTTSWLLGFSVLSVHCTLGLKQAADHCLDFQEKVLDWEYIDTLIHDKFVEIH